MVIKGALITHKCPHKHASTRHPCTTRQLSGQIGTPLCYCPCTVFQFCVPCVVKAAIRHHLGWDLDVYASSSSNTCYLSER